ncbi:hypothetical protein Q4Q34_04970 [Flavivirga abyssicola]|uniref:hypothetical protein n=1 Tax=Flavivirga abyssicola TaxID=3063533 RepID=UPI0026E0FF1E|nr:hypothetical protein [Flavivirga sp. MEBiC07777]WVK14378.1 hypothetical protein Q4Q34_04970 [Flavivirga sp. MEBiC07777]
MKNIILFTIILVSTFSYAQNNNSTHSENTKFVYGENGLEPRNFTVIVEGMDRHELLSKAKEWLNEKYKDADNVIIKNDKTDKTDDSDEMEKAKPSEKISFNGFTDNAICFGEEPDYNCEGLEYTIELRFRDGEYRFKPKKLKYKIASSNKKQTIGLKKHKFYSKEGKIKKGYEKVSSQIEALLNKINRSLLNYLTGKVQDDEW